MRLSPLSPTRSRSYSTDNGFQFADLPKNRLKPRQPRSAVIRSTAPASVTVSIIA